MEVETKYQKRPKIVWITLGVIAIVLVGLFVLASQEPPPPYAFLRKYPIVERKVTQDGKTSFVVLKGKYEDVAKDAEAEFSGQTDYMSSSSGFSSTSDGGWHVETRNYGLKDGIVSISSDIGGANLDVTRSEPWSMKMPESKEGYCAVAYSRPKTFLDKIMDWVKGVFGSKPTPPSTGPIPAAPMAPSQHGIEIKV